MLSFSTVWCLFWMVVDWMEKGEFWLLGRSNWYYSLGGEVIGIDWEEIMQKVWVNRCASFVYISSCNLTCFHSLLHTDLWSLGSLMFMLWNVRNQHVLVISIRIHIHVFKYFIFVFHAFDFVRRDIIRYLWSSSVILLLRLRPPLALIDSYILLYFVFVELRATKTPEMTDTSAVWVFFGSTGLRVGPQPWYLLGAIAKGAPLQAGMNDGLLHLLCHCFVLRVHQRSCCVFCVLGVWLKWIQQRGSGLFCGSLRKFCAMCFAYLSVGGTVEAIQYTDFAPKVYRRSQRCADYKYAAESSASVDRAAYFTFEWR